MYCQKKTTEPRSSDVGLELESGNGLESSSTPYFLGLGLGLELSGLDYINA